MGVILQVNDITKRYNDQAAITGVAFDIYEGEVLGIIGPNGAGKTTLLECIAGLLPADKGTVLWHGRPLAISQRKEAMFYMPDGIAPYAEHPVSKVIQFFASVYRQPPDKPQTVIEAFGLPPVLEKKTGELSKGYRRRLLLALGLLVPHVLLVMDEPFDGLDLRQTKDIMALLRAEAEKGRTFLLSIHQLTDAERVCDRFILMSLGTVRGKGTMDELRGQARINSGSLEDIFYALT